jgi:hypothetical protein
MSFNQNNFTPISSHGNSNSPNSWTYRTTDTKAEVSSQDYFIKKYPILHDGDFINVQAIDAVFSGSFSENSGKFEIVDLNSGLVQSVSGDGVNNTDPDNPVIELADVAVSGSFNDLVIVGTQTLKAVVIDDTGDGSYTQRVLAVNDINGAEATANKGAVNGYAGLDSNGIVPFNQLPDELMHFQGNWDAATNTPTLANTDVDAQGCVFRVSVAGTADFGAGNLTFVVGDWVYNTGVFWDKGDNVDAIATVFGRIGVITAQSGDYNADQITETATNKIMTADERADIGLSTLALNETGNVKANITGVSLIGFTAGIAYPFDINAGIATIVPAVTVYPASTVLTGFDSIFNPLISAGNPVGIIGKLIENPILKQKNTWRFQMSFSGKSQNINTGIDIFILNPETGFVNEHLVTLPSGTTSGTFTFEMSTISDMGSVGVGSGYILEVSSTITDGSLTMSLDSITRFNQATQSVVAYP